MSATPNRDYQALLNAAYVQLRKAREVIEVAEQAQREPIAVVGIGCRLPGNVADPESLWQLVRDKEVAVKEIPAERRSLEASPLDRETAPMWGGFLRGVDEFDPAFFGIAPREASKMDPQQRLLLEVAWETLEDAGLTTDRLSSTATAVFIGMFGSDYYLMQLGRGHHGALDFHSALGSAFSVAAGRLSYLWDLRGPSIAVDTACSSSLVAVHLACQSLRTRESDLALAGGVNLFLLPHWRDVGAQMGTVSPDGRCRPFDARANGSVPGEGCGIVALKRVSDARRDGDRVLAVIRGSAVNQDGRSLGLNAPNGLSQQAVIRRALANAGLDAAAVGYVEAHAAGTVLGDPIEVEALAQVYGRRSADDLPCAVGSIKANVGHTGGAAGITGLIKAILCLQHGEIPPQANLEVVNRDIPTGARLRFPTDAVLWQPRGQTRVAAVSAFGWSGTNAHVIVQESLDAEAIPARQQAELTSAYILPLSARRPEALCALIGEYAHALEGERGETISLTDLCYTASVRRNHFEYRTALVAESRAGLYACLREAAQNSEAVGRGSGSVPLGRQRKLAFVFSGGHGAVRGSARGLLEELPAFRAAVEHCDRLIRSRTDRSVLDVLRAADAHHLSGKPGDPEVTEAALFTLQVGLCAEWAACGIKPDAVVGHGVGELTAAWAAGVMDLSAAVAVLCAPTLEVVAQPAVAERLHGSFAGAEDIALQPPSVPMFVIGTGVGSERRAFDIGAWTRERRGADRPWPISAPRLAEGYDTLVDIGIGAEPALTEDRDRLVSVVPPIVGAGGGARAAFLKALGAVYARGHSIEWSRLYPDGGRCVRVPTYPFQRDRYWFDQDPRRSLVPAAGTGTQAVRSWSTELAYDAETRIWSCEFDLESIPYLRDHALDGTPVVPGALFVALAMKGFAETSGADAVVLKDIEFEKALFVRQDGRTELQVVFSRAGDQGTPFVVYGRFADGDVSRRHWTRHVSGTMGARFDAGMLPPAPVPIEEIRRRCPDTMAGSEFYAAMADRANTFGPSFQGVEEIFVGAGEALAYVGQPDVLTRDAGSHAIHPAVLDACIQALAVVLGLMRSDRRMPFVGRRVDRMYVHGHPRTSRLLSHVTVAAPRAHPSAPLADADICDENGRILVQARGVQYQELSMSSCGAVGRDTPWIEIDWRVKPSVFPPADAPIHEGFSTSDPAAWLVVLDRKGVGRAVAEEIRKRGGRCITVARGERYEVIDPDQYRVHPDRAEDFRELFSGLAAEQLDIRGIVYAWGLDASARDGTWQSWTDEQVAACAGLLHLVHGLCGGESAARSRLWILTDGVQELGRRPDVAALMQAPLWGFGRTVVHEHPELHCTNVDFAETGEPEEILAFVRELEQPDKETQIAFRGRTRHVARLRRRALVHIARRPAPAWRQDGTYLISGGRGGLGLTIAHWMVNRGARHLVLLGRSEPSPEQLGRIEVIRAAGADVMLAQDDVADAAAMSGLVDRIRQSMPPLRGVVHAAATLDDGVVVKQSAERFRAVLRPKVGGAWNLHQLTERDELDFFVLFSSAASLVGSPGQSNYAAANAFLDSLAHFRRGRGLHGVSINWGGWSEVGGAIRPEVERRRAAAEINTFTPEEGVAAFERVLSFDTAQIGPMNVGWERAVGSGWEVSLPFFSEVIRNDGRASSGQGALRTILLGLERDARGPRLESYFRTEVGKALGLSESEIDIDQPLNTMGMDSLMGLGLKNEVERELGVALPIAHLLRGDSIRDLVRYLLVQSASEVPTPIVRRSDPRATLAALDQLSNEQVDAMLAELQAEEQP